MDKKLFKNILLLITYTVVLVMVLSRLGLIAGGVAWVLGLVKPLLIGFALAFVLNRPCHFFFRLYDRGLSRTRARGAARPLAVVTSSSWGATWPTSRAGTTISSPTSTWMWRRWTCLA